MVIYIVLHIRHFVKRGITEVILGFNRGDKNWHKIFGSQVWNLGAKWGFGVIFVDFGDILWFW